MMRIGFQGDYGSFSAGVARNFVQKYVCDATVTYVPCYTTNGVLHALECQDITYGIFAIYNTRAGIVEETVSAIGRYRFRVVHVMIEEIRQNVLALPGQTCRDITRIIGHPVALAQSRTKIAQHFGKCVMDDGRTQGFADGAAAARALADGTLVASTAVVGSSMLAEIYDLEIIAHDVHDDATNKTTFLCVCYYDEK